MYEFVFIDPSPNLELLSSQLRNNMGRSVINVYTKYFSSFRPKSLWAFVGDKYFKLSDKRIPQEVDPLVCKLKKPFFTKFCLGNLKEKLSRIDPLLAHGTFQDYILLTGQLKAGPDLPITISNLTFDELLAKYPSSTIITSRVPAQGGKFSVTHWRTNYDIAEALGDDYYFFFDEKIRHELYKEGSYLVTVSEQKTTLDCLKRINPALERFEFEMVKSVNFLQNQNPWIQRYSSKIYLINDYSWQGVAVQLPDNWTKTFRKLVCIEKRR